jgi:spermidine synthase
MTVRRTVFEPLGPGLNRTWELSEVLYETRTPFQSVLIGRTAQGVSLFCDDERQSTESSQLTYHEALMVPTMLLARQLRRMLVIGSSEGVASELAAGWGAELVDHVDIDEAAVTACAEYLPYGYTVEALKEAERGTGRIRMHYRDGWEFLAEAARDGHRYDVIVIDLPDENEDPEAQHNRLYGKDFLRRCAELLTEGGVVGCQAGCPTLWRNSTLATAWDRFSEAFGTVLYYGSDEHEWAFLTGRVDRLDDPVSAVCHQLRDSARTPSTLDEPALRANTLPPHSLRTR